MKALKKALIGLCAVAALSVVMVSCDTGSNDDPAPAGDPAATNVEVPAGYQVVYIDTADFSGTAARIHMHTGNRIAATLHIAEIFGAAAQEYKTDRTLIQTFADDVLVSAGGYYWDSSFSNTASIVAGELVFTLTNIAVSDYKYAGTIAAPGLDSDYIGMVVKTDEWTTLTTPTADTEGAGAIRFEFMSASDAVVKAAQDITETFLLP